MGNNAHCGSCSGSGYAAAEFIIDTIKDLSSEHERITPDVLQAALFGKKEFTSLLEAQTSGLPAVTSMPENIEPPSLQPSSPMQTHAHGIGAMSHLEDTRRFFLDLLDELKSVQRWEYSEDLQALSRSIENSESFEGVWSHKDEIFSLLEFVNKHHSEEQRRFVFMFVEMGNGLLEVERYLAAHVSAARHDYSVSKSFNDTVDKQISHMAATMDGAQSLSEFAHFLGLKLSEIREIVEKKRRHDEAQLQKTARRMKALETSLKRMTSEVSKARKEVKGLKEEMKLDPLTRICNRRAYEHRIEEEWERFRADRKVFGLLLMDIDHFKLVNDTYGHWVGDRCLSELAGIVKACLRDSDFLARYGGEEFIAILPGTSGESTRQIAQRLCSAVEKTRFLLQDNEIRITVSIGGTHVMPADEDTESIFNRADAGLYEAKNRGRNGFVLV